MKYGEWRTVGDYQQGLNTNCSFFKNGNILLKGSARKMGSLLYG